MELFIDQKLLDPPATKGNVPAFLTKLWKIVEDKQYDHLVSWNENGTTIQIHQPVAFSQEILPKFYKHNNFSSFVRQVNMYGFRKRVDSSIGAKPGTADGDWEFYHNYFQRDHPESIAMMKRKGQLKEEIKLSNTQFSTLLQDVERLKDQHDLVEEKLNNVKTENERLWREVFDLRERHSSQQSMIVKLIQFFLQIMMNKPDHTRKRRAIRLHDGANKKMAIQCYDASPAVTPLTELVRTDGVSTSLSNDRLTELSPRDTIDVVNEGNSNNPHVKSEVTTHTHDTQPTPIKSPFIFPEIYKHPETGGVIDLTSCISNDDNSTPFALLSDKTSDFATLVKKLTTKTPQPLSTPVVNMPSVITRQKSFRDREEITTNVDKIEKSIETLQDMLNKQEINLDLSNLSSLYSDVQPNTGMQDLLKLLQQQSDDILPHEETEVIPFDDSGVAVPEGQVIAYTSFSPSHLINPEFTTVIDEHDDIHADLFESVLSEDDDDDDSTVRVTVVPPSTLS